jgi:hypothetical protein
VWWQLVADCRSKQLGGVHLRQKSFLELTERQARCERLWESQAICQLPDDLGASSGQASASGSIPWEETNHFRQAEAGSEAQRLKFFLQVVQPGLAGLMTVLFSTLSGYFGASVP